MSRTHYRIQDVIRFVESWAPPGVALQDDNSGLQVGDPDTKLSNILVTLDVTDRIIDEAIENQANLILSHHPLIYKPFRRLDYRDITGRIIAKLIQHNITVYSAHTNLDGTWDGVSITLARELGVSSPKYLRDPERAWQKKIVVFVPREALDEVRSAMAEAGAGIIGDYTHCSFNMPGTGTFLGTESTSPTVGKKGVIESVEEVRLEMLLPAWSAGAVVEAMIQAHPYEEVAYDLYSLDNKDVKYGFGAIGDLPEAMPLQEFVAIVREKLGLKTVCIVEGAIQELRRIAVCGGSGGALVEDAFQQKADVYITGEMKYHSCLEYENRMTVIVAGHYATERVILPVWVGKLQRWLGSSPVSVKETKMITNPVKYLI